MENRWRPSQGQGEPPSMEASSADWRSQLHPDARQRIVNKIMDTLRRHLPVDDPEGMNDVKKITQRFEDKIFSTAVSKEDFLRKISLKMLSLETKSQQNTSMNSQPGVSQISPDTGLLGGPPQVNNQGQLLTQSPMVSQPLGRQQILTKNLQNNTPATMQGSTSSPSIAGLSQPTLPNFGHISNMQNSHSSVNNYLAQGASTNIYGNAQRQLQGRQQQQSILSQQQSQNPLFYQNQLQSQLMKQKMPNNTNLRSMQQPQHSLLQANQIQPSQQSVMQIPSSLLSGQTFIQQSQVTSIQSATEPSLQQNQLNSIQQSVTSLLPQHVQAIARQSHQPLYSINQQSSPQQQSATIHQQSNLQTQQQQQQQQLLGQQANMSNIQQNHLLGQQTNIVEQQQRLPVQQNNLVNMQQPQQLLNQQNLSLHQQQLSQHTNMQSLQQQQQPQSQQQQQQHQLLSSLQNFSNFQPLQRSMQLFQQSKNMSQTQQQLQQSSMTLLHSQGQHTHLSSQQQLMPQFQSQTEQLQQPLAVQQQPNSMQREQQKPFMPSQRGIPKISSSMPIDSTAQTRHNVTDWQEEAYQKLLVMKEAYFAELYEFNQKISHKLQQPDPMPHAKQSESYEKFKSFKVVLDRMLAFLHIPKINITHVMKEKLPSYEKQIVGMLSLNRRLKGAPSEQQGQQQVQQQGQQQFLPSVGLAQNAQHHPSQVIKALQQENHGNQVQQINMLSSLTTMQSTMTSSMQHGAMTLSNLAASATQQNLTNSVQSASDMDSVPLNSFGSLQQGSLDSVQQNGLGPLQNSDCTTQQINLNNMSQSSMSASQKNYTMQNSNVLQQQNLKQQQQELLVQNQSARQTTHQLATSGPPQTQAISVPTPGISASPLLAESTSQEGDIPNPTIMSRSSASERPVETLIKAVQSLSPKALSYAVSDITSVVSMIDRISGSAPGNGSRAAVGEDLVAMAKCRSQARSFLSQDGGATVNKMKRHISVMSINNASSAGSINENFKTRTSLDSSEIEYTEASRVKRQKLELNHALKEEIWEINQKLIDTVVSICDEDSDPVAALSEGGEGIIVKCSFSAVAFSPSLKAKLVSIHMPPISTLRLLVPGNYPKSSPRLLDKLPFESGKENEEFYFKAKSSFITSFCSLSQPMSLGEMARTWDACARKVIVEYAHQIGGRSFSSTYGAWENCIGA